MSANIEIVTREKRRLPQRCTFARTDARGSPENLSASVVGMIGVPFDELV